MKGLLLKGGRVLDPTRWRSEVADVRILSGRIVELGPNLAPEGDEVVDCGGLWLMPGFIDLHTHLREPGFEDAEDVATGTAAAAAGGYTAVCPMANTDPVCDSPAVAELVLRRAEEVGLADVFPVGAITRGLKGSELAEFGALRASSAAVDCFSDDGKPVADPLVMRRALQYAKTFDAVVCNHSEEPALTRGAQMNEGATSSLLGLPGWPREAEEVMIARDLILAAGVGSRLHVPHVSTAGSVELIRTAKARGVRVTAEVTPHHLVLDETLVAAYDPNLKVNPPLRTSADVTALRIGLADGTIDAVATDHAPHPPEQKEQEWEHAPPGLLGLETAFAAVVTDLVDPEAHRPDSEAGTLDLLTAIARFTTGPAGVRRVGGHGGALERGAPAHLTVVDPQARWVVEGRRLRSKARNTPFEGKKLTTRPVHTLLRGRFTLRDGLVREGAA
ncbi:MAG: dihydroorotase [Nitriliruptorales bacterium]